MFSRCILEQTASYIFHCSAGAVMVSPVNRSAISVSWELLQARGGSIIHYIVWVRSLSDPSDIHIESVPSSATRTLISKLSKA